MKKIALISAAVWACCAAFAANPVIRVEGGMIQGMKEGKVTVFKGIPYAAPPVGDLRWKAPQPVRPWKGVKVCDQFGPIAMQADQDPNSFYCKEFYWKGLPERSEDCLYLNVWTPSKAVGKSSKKLPVALWIHGGGFGAGFSNEITMDGTEWAKRGVILVSINYRLGMLGFLGGNYGIQDQMAALKWVHDNIAAFGGDPENITLMGQSAGALSIKQLVSSPLSKDYVAKAIIQSGGGIAAPSTAPAKQQEASDGHELAEAAGYASVDAMRSVPYAELDAKLQPVIMGLFLQALKEGKDATAAIVTVPHWDGKVVDKDFDTAVYDGTVADIPYLIGSVTADGEMLGGEGVRRFSHYRNAHSANKAYSYQFTRNLPGDDEDPSKDSGAFHSGELWYMFGTLDRSWRPFTKADYKLSKQMLDAWTRFCKTGNPGWAPDTEASPSMKVFDIQ